MTLAQDANAKVTGTLTILGGGHRIEGTVTATRFSWHSASSACPGLVGGTTISSRCPSARGRVAVPRSVSGSSRSSRVGHRWPGRTIHCNVRAKGPTKIIKKLWRCRDENDMAPKPGAVAKSKLHSRPLVMPEFAVYRDSRDLIHCNMIGRKIVRDVQALAVIVDAFETHRQSR